MLIEYKITFEDGEVTITQRIDNGPSRNSRGPDSLKRPIIARSLGSSFAAGKGSGGPDADTGPGGGGPDADTGPGGGGPDADTGPGGGGPGGGPVVIFGPIIIMGGATGKATTPDVPQKANALKPTIDRAPLPKAKAPVGGTVRGVFEIQKQKKDKWCWAAVSVTMDHYFSTGSTSSQCKIANEVLELKQCCRDSEPCNRPAKLEDALDAVKLPYQVLRGPLLFSEIKEQIDAELPICVMVKWSGRGAHFVVISGYQITKSGEQYVEVADPLYLNSVIPYDLFLSAYQNSEDPLGGGHWQATFLMDREKGENDNGTV